MLPFCTVIVRIHTFYKNLLIRLALLDLIQISAVDTYAPAVVSRDTL